jgi:raffinose/stachyose/melibiose transport system substrate-binding protein
MFQAAFCAARRVGRAAFGLVGLTALFLAAAVLAQDEDTTRFALVIGNSDYRHIDELPNPVNDVEDLSEKLRALDFDVTVLANESYAAIQDGITAFGQKSIGAEIALIFYAGHGMQVDGENYLLTVDARPRQEDWLEEHAIRSTDLREIFAFVEPDLAMLILDACRDNPFFGVVSDRPGLASGTVAENEINPSRGAAGTLIAFAAEPGKTAMDGGDGNSPFTTALLQWIDQPGLEVGFMFRKVRQTVMELTSGHQVPWVEESLIDTFYLHTGMRMEGGDVGLAALLFEQVPEFEHPLEQRAFLEFASRLFGEQALEDRPQVVQASLDAGAAEADAEDWEDQALVHGALTWLPIRGSTDPEVFRRFVERFPESPFADLAEARLAELSTSDPATDATGDPASTGTAPADGTPARRADPGAVADGSAEASPSAGDAPEAPDEAAQSEIPVDPEVYAAVEEDLSLDRSQRAALQGLLAEAGYYRGPLDAAIGPMSRAAIEAFQRDAELYATGHVDRATLRALVARAATDRLLGDIPDGERRAIHELAAFGLSGSDAEPQVIRVASWHRFPEVLAVWQRIADAFEAEHPGTLVEFDTRILSDYKAQLLSMLGSRHPPDLFASFGGGHLRSLVEANFVRDLTQSVGADLATSFKPGALANLVVDDRLYGVPARITLASLWANRAHLEAAGVAPEELETWRGLLEAVSKLKAAGITPISVGAGEGWPMSLYWSGLALGLGGRDAMEDALSGADAGFRADEFVEAGELLAELAALEPFQRRHLQADENQSIGTFTDGYAAMHLNGDWVQSRLLRTWKGSNPQEEIVRIPFPPRDLMPDDTLVTLGGVTSWVVREDAPEETETLLRELAGVEAQRTLAAMGFGIPSIANADDALEDPVQQAVAGTLTVTDYHQLFLDQLLGPVAGEAVNDAVVALARGTATPEETASAIEAAWAPFRAAWGIAASADPAAAPVAAE